MIKDILLDADGVTITKHPFFSERLSERLGIPLEQIVPFFKGEFGQCSTGKADLRMAITPYLSKWGWTGTFDELLDFWFSGESQANEEVLGVVRKLRGKGIRISIISDNEAERAKYIEEQMDFGKHFDHLFFSCRLRHKKSEPEFFRAVLNMLGSKPEEVMAWDDDPKNTEVAKELGLNAVTYTDFKGFAEALASLI